MNRAERLSHLHGLLKTRRPVSMATLLDRLQVSRATVVRDLAYLRLFFAAPVTYDREAHGYRYAPGAETAELPGFWLNESELHALLASARLLEQVQPGLLAPHLAALTGRLRRALGESGHAAEAVADRIRLVAMGQRRLDPERFGVAAQAVLGGRVLEIEYEGRTRGERTHRRVHPQRLLHYRDNWYLLAWCEHAATLRLFSLDRLRRAHLEAGAARRVDPAELDRFIDAGFGIFGGPPQGHAVLRFSPARSRWVADEVWHPEQEGSWHGDAYLLRLPYADPRELVFDILRHGPEVEVLEPPDLRSQVAHAHRVAAAQYEIAGGGALGEPPGGV